MPIYIAFYQTEGKCSVVKILQVLLQEREDMLEHIEKRPDAMWKSSIWSFRNDAKVYGSPMYDAVWMSVTAARSDDQMRKMLSHLKAAAVPFESLKVAA